MTQALEATWPQEVQEALAILRAWKDELIDPGTDQYPAKALWRLYVEQRYFDDQVLDEEELEAILACNNNPDHEVIGKKRELERAIFGTYKNNNKDTGTKIAAQALRQCGHRALFDISDAIGYFFENGFRLSLIIDTEGQVGFNSFKTGSGNKVRRVVDIPFAIPGYDINQEISAELDEEQREYLDYLVCEFAYNVVGWSNPTIDSEIMNRFAEDQEYMFRTLIAWSRDKNLFLQHCWVKWVFNCHFKASAESEYDLGEILRAL